MKNIDNIYTNIVGNFELKQIVFKFKFEFKFKI